MRHAIIMAGGSGTRFWPASRARRPKQLLSLWGDEPLIHSTSSRLAPPIPTSHQWVITSADILDAVRAVLPDLPPSQIIAEPCPRNTAPCVGLAAALLQADADAQGAPSPLIGVFPSDHLIRDLPAWHACLDAAFDAAAASPSIITLGIQPTRPETGFGYIEASSSPNGLTPLPVRRFVEKPDHATALSYLGSGNFLWNAGIFVFRASTMLALIDRHLPSLSAGLRDLAAYWRTPQWPDAFARIFSTLPSISIDYAVMEPAAAQGAVQTIPASFTWSDVGHWGSLDEAAQPDPNGNITLGESLTLDSQRCVVAQLSSAKRLVVTLGVHDLVVVDTDDALLVCDRDQVQRVREVIDHLKASGRTDLL
jgi:mannose-1-phosphate guanylyltransferase